MPAVRSLRVWSPLPFLAALIAFLVAGQLWLEGDRRERASVFTLLSSGLICFSIGCVCRTSWGISFAHDPVPSPAALEPRQ